MNTTPTAEEQLTLELINTFRTDPGGEYARLTDSSVYGEIANAINFFGVDLNALEAQLDALNAVAPLAWNGNLADAARTHNGEMIAADDQSHQLPGEAGLGDRVTAAGYTGWTALGENIYAFADSMFHGHAGFIVDWGYDDEDFDSNGVRYSDWQSRGDGIQDPAGHRINLISSNFTEIGIGVTRETSAATDVGEYVVTHDIGTRSSYQAQFLGVVIDDVDNDDFYDIGEGLGGVNVSLTGSPGTFSTTSWSSGGWQIAVPAGTYTITFSGGGLADPIQRTATLGNANVKVDVEAEVSDVGTDNDDVLNGDSSGETIDGLGGDDTINGNGGNDVLIGNGQDDVLNGGSGNDTLTGSAGEDTLDGGSGNDFARGNVRDDSILGGGGNDTLNGNNGSDTLDGGAGTDRLLGGPVNDSLLGGAGSDDLSGNAGDDTMRGGTGDDDIAGGAGNDIGFGDAGADTISGNGANDTVYGGSEDDLIRGNAGNDLVLGDAGDDQLLGGNGDDTVDGGAGEDRLAGNNSTDVFRFDDGDTGSTIASADIIADFSRSEGDTIDLSRVDAISGGGDNAFSFIGTSAFSGTAGELRYEQSGGRTNVFGDTDGDGTADFALQLLGNIDLVAGDFVL